MMRSGYSEVKIADLLPTKEYTCAAESQHEFLLSAVHMEFYVK